MFRINLYGFNLPEPDMVGLEAIVLINFSSNIPVKPVFLFPEIYRQPMMADVLPSGLVLFFLSAFQNRIVATARPDGNNPECFVYARDWRLQPDQPGRRKSELSLFLCAFPQVARKIWSFRVIFLFRSAREVNR